MPGGALAQSANIAPRTSCVTPGGSRRMGLCARCVTGLIPLVREPPVSYGGKARRSLIRTPEAWRPSAERTSNDHGRHPRRVDRCISRRRRTPLRRVPVCRVSGIAPAIRTTAQSVGLALTTYVSRRIRRSASSASDAMVRTTSVAERDSVIRSMASPAQTGTTRMSPFCSA